MRNMSAISCAFASRGGHCCSARAGTASQSLWMCSSGYFMLNGQVRGVNEIHIVL